MVNSPIRSSTSFLVHSRHLTPMATWISLLVRRQLIVNSPIRSLTSFLTRGRHLTPMATWISLLTRLSFDNIWPREYFENFQRGDRVYIATLDSYRDLY